MSFRALLGGLALFFAALVMPAEAAVCDGETAGKAEKYVLPNGLEIILACRDQGSGVVHVNWWTHVGSSDEVAGKSGFAHLFEHLMFEGTANTGPKPNLTLLTRYTGSASMVNGSTSFDYTNFMQTVPQSALDLTLWLESERIGYLMQTFDKKLLDVQREVVRNERRQQHESAPYAEEYDLVLQALYPQGHPYRHMPIGDHEDIEGANLRDVVDFWKTWYVPSNITLAVVGDLPPDTKERILKWFGTFPRSERPRHFMAETPRIEDGPRRIETSDKLAKLTHVHYAWHTPRIYSVDDAALDILSSVLSNKNTGRLFKKLVVGGLAKDVGAYQLGIGLSSTFHIVVEILPGTDPEKITEIVRAELDAILRNGIPDKELAVVKAQYEFAEASKETLYWFAEELQKCNHYTGDPQSDNCGAARHLTVTSAGIRQAIGKYLSARQSVEVIVRPAKAGALAAAVLEKKTASPKPLAQSQELEFPTEEFRTKQPIVGERASFKWPTVNRFIVNGAEVWHVRRPGARIVEFRMATPGGTVTDPAGKFGRAAACSDLLNSGTAELDRVAFTEELALIGSLGAGAEFQNTVFSMQTTRQNFPQGLALLGKLVTRPGLRDEDHALIIDRAVNDLKQGRLVPDKIAGRLSGRVFYGADHPIGNIATEDSLRSITTADCRRFVNEWIHPAGTKIVIVGDISAEEVRALLEKSFSGWLGGARPMELPPISPIATGRIYLVDAPGAAQSMVLAGHSGPKFDPAQYTASNIALSIFGGPFSSRLNMKLREEMGVAYYAHALFKYFPPQSVLRMVSSVQTDATAETVAVMTEELRKMARSGATEQELGSMKSGELAQLPIIASTTKKTADALTLLLSRGLPSDWYDGLEQRVRNIGREEVNAAAVRDFHPDDLRFLVVGDAAKVRAKLEELIRQGRIPVGKIVELDADGNEVK